MLEKPPSESGTRRTQSLCSKGDNDEGQGRGRFLDLAPARLEAMAGGKWHFREAGMERRA
jgi:hypothetical protein